MEKIPEQCFAITLTNHSVQAQILHFTNARPRFRPDWASSGACSVHNAYMQSYIYWYNMACDVKRTYAIQTLHVRYACSVARLVMVGLDSSLQSAILHLVPSCNVAGLVIDLDRVEQSVYL